MDKLRSAVKAILPSRARSFLRGAYYKVLPRRIRVFFRESYRDFVFRRAMKQFLKDPIAHAHPGSAILLDLIYGWGNEAWSALDEYLADCINHAMASSGPILECGSGLSTILIGAIAKKQGQSHFALEHNSEWAIKVKKYLNRYKIDSVVQCTKPLKDYGDFCWYDVPLESMPDSFSLVVCDGPPGSTKGGRYGLAPIMRERLKPGSIILLDDAEREQELAIAKLWEVELDAHLDLLATDKPYIKMTMTNRRQHQRQRRPVEQAKLYQKRL
jgi:predicted O-methyltransferase YrrM